MLLRVVVIVGNRGLGNTSLHDQVQTLNYLLLASRCQLKTLIRGSDCELQSRWIQYFSTAYRSTIWVYVYILLCSDVTVLQFCNMNENHVGRGPKNFRPT